MTEQQQIQRLESQVEALALHLRETLQLLEEVTDTVETHATCDGYNGKISRINRISRLRINLSSIRQRNDK